MRFEGFWIGAKIQPLDEQRPDGVTSMGSAKDVLKPPAILDPIQKLPNPFEGTGLPNPFDPFEAFEQPDASGGGGVAVSPLPPLVDRDSAEVLEEEKLLRRRRAAEDSSTIATSPLGVVGGDDVSGRPMLVGGS